MAPADKIKIHDDTIEANQAQYNLDKETAKISALLSIKLEKYEYVTSKQFNIIQDGPFWGCLRIRGGKKFSPP